MRENTGTTKVKGGFYFSRKTWEMVAVNGKEGTLPGGADEKYVKVPTVLMLAGAPLLGGALVLFLPFIGFALFFSALARKVGLPLKASTEPKPLAAKR